MRKAMILAAAVSAAFFAFDSQAGTALCGKHYSVTAHLNAKAQTMVASGVTAEAFALEIYASQNGRYSVVLTRADGISCIIGSGENWRIQKAEYGQGS